MSAKEISVAEKEPNEALQVKRSTSEFGDFSARANFFWCKILFLQNSVESLEISVKVININVDKENPVLNRCEALKEYSEFMEQVKFNLENEISDPFTTAIKQSIKQGFLSDYLSRKSTEVENMLLTEYDYDTDIAVQRQEAYESGVEKGLQQKAIETAKNALKMDLPIKQISTLTGLSIEEIQALAK